MSDLRCRWLLLKAAFGPRKPLAPGKTLARTSLGEMGLLGPAGVWKPPPPDRGLIR